MALTDKLTAIADAIRAKTGKTAAMTLEQMPGEISGITGGGSSSADVRYVTFMNGNTVLYKKPVAVGDDCVDVLTKGLIEKPTKESTVQYNYTYYGWGATDNGAADSTILQNITEDKSVYAIYTATVRTYTITYYDSDGTTVLKTETLAYGTTPATYTPGKVGYDFTGWTPAIAIVTGNASYVAAWAESGVFVEEIADSWEDIIAAVNDGTYKTKYKLGNYKPLSYTYGGATKTFNMQIVAFDKDILADGSGVAPITWIAMGNIDQAEKEIHSGYSSTIGWSNSYGRSELQRVVGNNLDVDVVTSAAKPVIKYHYEYVGTAIVEVSTTDTWWIPSWRELFGTTGSGVTYTNVFTDNASRIKVACAYTNPEEYWLRDISTYTNQTTFNFRRVATSGASGAANGKQSGNADLVLCFCT